MPGIYFERCRTLRAMFSVARTHLAHEPTTRSVMLACTECWNDEATDAIYESVHWSPLPVPGVEWKYVETKLLDQLLKWDHNEASVWAFAAICTEEGWEEHTGTVNGELKTVYFERKCPVMIVQRDGDQLRGTWLGRPLRGWLDAPTSMQDREHRSTPLVVLDESPTPLLGREPELHAQVLADPYDRSTRDVLRDLWIERGDPRGDYCAASDPRAIDHVRAAESIAAYGRSWVGALQSVIPLSGALFGYGPWIRAAIIYADRAALDAVSDAAEWGSIERIEFAMHSARMISPRMSNARAIGPLTLDELAPLRTGSWQIRELDVEIDRDPSELATLDLPLTRLCLRPSRTIDPSWLAGLARLRTAPWWPTLERLEIWLPGGFDTPAEDMMRVFRDAAVGDQLAVGVLDAGQRTGWMVVSRNRVPVAELAIPNLHADLGVALVALGVEAKAPDLVEGDDWLTFALGVPGIQPI